MSDQPTTPANESTPGIGALLRLYWFFIAHSAAAILVLKMIMLHKQQSLIFNGALFLIFITAILARYIDIRYCKGETADCKRATMKDFSTWSLFVIIGYGFLFAVIHLSVLLTH
jgi:hypothetical protein